MQNGLERNSSDQQAWDIYQEYQVRKSGRGHRFKGKFLVMFATRHGPFFMKENGRKTEDWRESETFASIEATQEFLSRLNAAPIRQKIRERDLFCRRSGEYWDQIFVACRHTARIYRIEHVAPERWVTNEYTARAHSDGRLEI